LTPEDKYIIVTNFDYWDDDIREYLDFTSHIGEPRRIVASHYLDQFDTLTPEILYEAINQDGVVADHMDFTIW